MNGACAGWPWGAASAVLRRRRPLEGDAAVAGGCAAWGSGAIGIDGVAATGTKGVGAANAGAAAGALTEGAAQLPRALPFLEAPIIARTARVVAPIVVANHVSYLDIFLAAAVLGPYYPVARADISGWVRSPPSACPSSAGGPAPASARRPVPPPPAALPLALPLLSSSRASGCNHNRPTPRLAGRRCALRSRCLGG